MRYPLNLPIERLALLDGWEGICAWDGLPLALGEMHVDHLLPQAAHEAGGTEWAKVVLDYAGAHHAGGVGAAEFDVDALYNLVPSCGRHNRLKSEAVPPIVSRLLEIAAKRANDIEKRAGEYTRNRKIQSALAVVASADDDVWGDTVLRLVDAGTDTELIRRLVHLYVAFGVLEYQGYFTAARRRTWLVVPPGERSLAVVLESPGDEGTSTQNAAEVVALAVEQQHPGFLTVLHYDKEPDEPWGDFWKPVPLVNGVPEFLSPPTEARITMYRSLEAAGLARAPERLVDMLQAQPAEESGIPRPPQQSRGLRR